MAGGPLRFETWFPATPAQGSPLHYSNATGLMGLGVANATNVTADVIFRGHCPIFLPALPSGQLKLDLWSLSTGTGDLRVNPKWNKTAAGSAPMPSLTAEGATTITFSSEVWVRTKIVLDAFSIAVGDILVMDLTFEDASMTLSAESLHWPFLIWE